MYINQMNIDQYYSYSAALPAASGFASSLAAGDGGDGGRQRRSAGSHVKPPGLEVINSIRFIFFLSHFALLTLLAAASQCCVLLPLLPAALQQDAVCCDTMLLDATVAAYETAWYNTLLM